MSGDEPAFPTHDDSATPNHAVHSYLAGGLTKREFFATMAVVGVMSREDPPVQPRNVAEYAVEIADALIAELGKTPHPTNP